MRRNVRFSPFACAFTHSPSHGASMTRRKRMVEEEHGPGGRSGRPSRKTGQQNNGRGFCSGTGGRLAMCSRPSAINIEAEEAVGNCLAAPSAS